MLIVPQKTAGVNLSDFDVEGGLSPKGEDTALLESNRSAPLGPSGPLEASSPLDTPDGFKAINSPATEEIPPKPPSNPTVDVFPGSSPASVGLSPIYVNSNTRAITHILDSYLAHCYKLEHSPCTILHLRSKLDASTALYRVNASSASRYFQEGRAQMKRNIRQRLTASPKRGVFFHLTVDAKKHSLTEAWPSMWPEFNRFKTCLNNYRKRHMNASHGTRYLAALEPHESDYPHLHVYCPGLRWLIKRQDLSKMDQWWGMGSVKTEKELRRDSAGSYIAKYISKLDGWSQVSLAMIWFYGIRVYNLSHKYRVKKSEGEWELLATYRDPRALAKGLGMELREAEAFLEAWAAMDDNLIQLEPGVSLEN